MGLREEMAERAKAMNEAQAERLQNAQLPNAAMIAVAVSMQGFGDYWKMVQKLVGHLPAHEGRQAGLQLLEFLAENIERCAEELRRQTDA